jgi:hypothetical protein
VVVVDCFWSDGWDLRLKLYEAWFKDGYENAFVDFMLALRSFLLGIL